MTLNRVSDDLMKVRYAVFNFPSTSIRKDVEDGVDPCDILGTKFPSFRRSENVLILGVPPGCHVDLGYENKVIGRLENRGWSSLEDMFEDQHDLHVSETSEIVLNKIVVITKSWENVLADHLSSENSHSEDSWSLGEPISDKWVSKQTLTDLLSVIGRTHRGESISKWGGITCVDTIRELPPSKYHPRALASIRIPSDSFLGQYSAVLSALVLSDSVIRFFGHDIVITREKTVVGATEFESILGLPVVISLSRVGDSFVLLVGAETIEVSSPSSLVSEFEGYVRVNNFRLLSGSTEISVEELEITEL